MNMLGFITTNNLWWIAIASLIALNATIVAFRFTTRLWFTKPPQAKAWLMGGLSTTALGAWFLYAICIYAFNDNAMVSALTTALSIACLILITLLISMLDMFLRAKKTSSQHSREHL